MDFLITGSKITQLKKTEEFYIRTEDGREIVVNEVLSLGNDRGYIFSNKGNFTNTELKELEQFMANREE